MGHYAEMMGLVARRANCLSSALARIINIASIIRPDGQTYVFLYDDESSAEALVLFQKVQQLAKKTEPRWRGVNRMSWRKE